jgi:hypothetical protein
LRPPGNDVYLVPLSVRAMFKLKVAGILAGPPVRLRVLAWWKMG